jgi:hypothetical protein
MVLQSDTEECHRMTLHDGRLLSETKIDVGQGTICTVDCVERP